MLITPVLPVVAEPAAAGVWACAPTVANRAAAANRAARISGPRNREAVVILEFTLFLLVFKKIFKKSRSSEIAFRNSVAVPGRESIAQSTRAEPADTANVADPRNPLKRRSRSRLVS